MTPTIAYKGGTLLSSMLEKKLKLSKVKMLPEAMPHK